MSIKRHIEALRAPAALEVATGPEHTAISFILADRTVSYPRSALERWECSAGPGRQRLLIQVGGDGVEVEGEGLQAVMEALDAGRFRSLRSGRGDGVRIDRLSLTRSDRAGKISRAV